MSSPIHFIIATPPFTQSSNGVMILYYLSDLLSSLGHKTTLYPLEKTVFQEQWESYPQRYIDRTETDEQRLDAGAIIICSETAPQALIESLPPKRRIWFLMNKPYILTKSIVSYRSNDLVIAYSGLISKIYFNLFITREIPEISGGQNDVNTRATKENLIVFYFGKSRRTDIPQRLKDLIKTSKAEVVSVNRLYPKSRDELFSLLRRARLVVSYDPMTNLNYEATLCGTPCYIIDNYMRIDYSNYNIPLLGMFEDETLIEHHYNHGLDAKTHDLIVETYHHTNAGSLGMARKFVQLTQQWFDYVETAAQGGAPRWLLDQHNQLRILNDKQANELAGVLHVDASLHHHIPLSSIKQRAVHRKNRLIWNIRRAWYKHVLGLIGAELHRKLHKREAPKRRFESSSAKS